MMIWILFAFLTVLAALAVLIPLTRGGRSVAPDHQQDVAIYKDQLGELERDLARGVIEPAEAEAARAEIARRLLQASRREAAEEESHREGDDAGPRRMIASAAAIVLVPLGALGLYLMAGSPQLADQPLADRIAASSDNPDIEVMVARVERHLADNPEDGRGWAVVAPVYMRLGRPDDAARAYRNAIRIEGESQSLQTNLGEALVVANQGMITADAADAFTRAVALEPQAVKPRFFLAIALAQEGRREEAIEAWQALLSGADGTEPWVPAAQAELAELGVEPPVIAGQPPIQAPDRQGGALPGPSGEDVAAASQMSQGDRQEMITGMVARLDERLSADGGSVEEWTRLVRAYVVLGDKPAARGALAKAQAAMAGDAQALSTLDKLAADAGLKS